MVESRGSGRPVCSSHRELRDGPPVVAIGADDLSARFAAMQGIDQLREAVLGRMRRDHHVTTALAGPESHGADEDQPIPNQRGPR